MAFHISRNVHYAKHFSRSSIFLEPFAKCSTKWHVFHRGYSEKKNELVQSVVIKNFNEPVTIETKESVAKLKPGQVRIKVHCCAINVADCLMWAGLSENKPKLPFVPGFEISGEVLEVAETPKKSSEDEESDNEDALRVGDRVLALNKETLNGFSTECISDVKDVFSIPSSVSYKKAASLADSYGTALLGISRRGKVQKDDIVLVTAAAGGLGLAAVDIAANVYKAKVIAVCGTEDRASLVRDKGAWAAFTFRGDKILKEEVSKISNGKGADIVFEAVGGDVFKSAMECIAVEGKVIVGGFTSRDAPQLPLNDLIQLPSFSLIGVSLSNYRSKMFPVYRRTINDVIEMCEQGLIVPHISETFQFKDINEALSYVKDNKSTGKVILEIIKN
ncbi:quinone oxidoreductase-like protein 2 [Planococcus citri]|uniref:quinone oxidoreductase-like protein 2 n=1 Tax=Planococcus citri TaxID=170843 RepID=UPI0031F73002